MYIHRYVYICGAGAHRGADDNRDRVPPDEQIRATTSGSPTPQYPANPTLLKHMTSKLGSDQLITFRKVSESVDSDQTRPSKHTPPVLCVGACSLTGVRTSMVTEYPPTCAPASQSAVRIASFFLWLPAARRGNNFLGSLR